MTSVQARVHAAVIEPPPAFRVEPIEAEIVERVMGYLQPSGFKPAGPPAPSASA